MYPREYSYYLLTRSSSSFMCQFFNLVKQQPSIQIRQYQFTDYRIVKYFQRIPDSEHILYYTATIGYLDIFDYLARTNPNINLEQYLRNGILNRNVPIVKYILDRIETIIDQPKIVVETFRVGVSGILNLVSAKIPHIRELIQDKDVYKHNESQIRFLVHHGTNPNLALNMAAEIGRSGLIRFLLRHGADINADRAIALRTAARNHNLQLVRWLLTISSPQYIGEVLASAIYQARIPEERVLDTVRLILTVPVPANDIRAIVPRVRENGYRTVYQYLSMINSNTNP